MTASDPSRFVVSKIVSSYEPLGGFDYFGEVGLVKVNDPNK